MIFILNNIYNEIILYLIILKLYLYDYIKNKRNNTMMNERGKTIIIPI